MSKIALRAVEVSKLFELSAYHAISFKEEFTRSFSRIFRKDEGNRREYFWALKDVSFAVEKGKVFCIIGENGAGKSTLLKILSSVIEFTSGRVELYQRVTSLLEVGTGFHPDISGRENIYFNGSLLGMPRSEIKKKFDEIVNFSGIEPFLDMPVKHYSSGMRMRLAFSIAAHLEPEILIIDEVLSVGDLEFKERSLEKLKNIASDSGTTVILTSHDLGILREIAQEGIVLEEGRVIARGKIDDINEYYKTETFSKLAFKASKEKRQKAEAGIKGHKGQPQEPANHEQTLRTKQDEQKISIAARDDNIEDDDTNVDSSITDRKFQKSVSEKSVISLESPSWLENSSGENEENNAISMAAGNIITHPITTDDGSITINGFYVYSPRKNPWERFTTEDELEILIDIETHRIDKRSNPVIYVSDSSGTPVMTTAPAFYNRSMMITLSDTRYLWCAKLPAKYFNAGIYHLTLAIFEYEQLSPLLRLENLATLRIHPGSSGLKIKGALLPRWEWDMRFGDMLYDSENDSNNEKKSSEEKVSDITKTELAREYLKAQAQKVWDLSTAPAGYFTRLLEAKIYAKQKSPGDKIHMNDPVILAIRYQLTREKMLYPVVHFLDQKANSICYSSPVFFNALPVEGKGDTIHATVSIPPHFFNSGQYRLDVAFTDKEQTVMDNRINNLLKFEVYPWQPDEGIPYIRGKGFSRPLIPWEMLPVIQPDNTLAHTPFDPENTGIIQINNLSYMHSGEGGDQDELRFFLHGKSKKISIGFLKLLLFDFYGQCIAEFTGNLPEITGDIQQQWQFNIKIPALGLRMPCILVLHIRYMENDNVSEEFLKLLAYDPGEDKDSHPGIFQFKAGISLQPFNSNA